jgi:2-polyprenyl-3-methyl-5-hydroxy-6-metoxy-1,4-benzoquinol methylase
VKNYGIVDGYEHRKEVPHYDDTVNKDEFQFPVYQAAQRLAHHIEAKAIIDLGCGSGYKLLNMFGPKMERCGVEVDPTLSWLREKYPAMNWYRYGTLLWRWRQIDRNLSPTILICSDVIEHVPDPDQLIDYILRLQPDKVVLSTPDRLQLAMGTEMGPPHNQHHVREWTAAELVSYLGQWFSIDEVMATKTTAVVMTPKEKEVT